MKKPCRFLPALLVLLCLATGPLTAQYSRIPHATKTSIQNRFADLIAQNKMVGGSIGIVRNGEIIYLDGIGYRDRENQIPADECTLFRLGSFSKTMTAILAMQLREQGRLDMQQEISRYVPLFPVRQDTPINAHLLLSHLAGMSDYTPIPLSYMYDNPSHNANEAVKLFNELPLADIAFPVQDPDAVYSNIGYNLMGAAVQNIAREPYEQMVINRIARPAQMPRFQPEYFWKFLDNVSKHYSTDDNLPVTQAATTRGEIICTLPSGGYIGSAVDLALFARGMIEGLYVNQQSRTMMTTQYCNLTGRGRHGYSMYKEVYIGRTFYFTGGGILGGSCIIVFNDNWTHAVVVISNSLNSFKHYKSVARDILFELPDYTVLPGNQYAAGPLPQTQLSVTADQNSFYYDNATSVTVNSTMESGSYVRLQGEVIRLLPGFTAEPGANFLAHTGNPNEDCMEQPPGGFTPKTSPDSPSQALSQGAVLFPNPGTGVVTLRSAQDFTLIEVFDVQGQRVSSFNQAAGREARLDLQGLPAGTFVVRVHTAEGVQHVKYVLTH